jgi:hypothetical protein
LSGSADEAMRREAHLHLHARGADRRELPLLRELELLEAARVGERRVERLRVERGDAGIGEHERVVRLDVEAAEAEVGRAASTLNGTPARARSSPCGAAGR